MTDSQEVDSRSPVARSHVGNKCDKCGGTGWVRHVASPSTTSDTSLNPSPVLAVSVPVSVPERFGHESTRDVHADGVGEAGGEMNEPTLRELALKAERGPWRVEHRNEDKFDEYALLSVEIPLGTVRLGRSEAEYVAAANPSAILALLDERDQAVVDRDTARDALSECGWFLSEGDYTNTTKQGYVDAQRLIARARLVLGEDT